VGERGGENMEEMCVVEREYSNIISLYIQLYLG